MKHSKAKLWLLVSGALFVVGALALTGLVWFGVPSRVPYKYIDLNTPGVSVRERYRPPLSLYLGDEIPRMYQASVGTETLLIHEEARYRYAPALGTTAGPSQTVVVDGLEPSCTHLVRKSEREVVLWWGTCAAIGDPVGFVLRLEGTGVTLAVRGTVRSAGTFTAWDVL